MDVRSSLHSLNVADNQEDRKGAKPGDFQSQTPSQQSSKTKVTTKKNLNQQNQKKQKKIQEEHTMYDEDDDDEGGQGNHFALYQVKMQAIEEESEDSDLANGDDLDPD